MEFILTILLISFLSIPFSDLLFFLADMLLLRLVAPLVGPHACRPAASLFFGDRRRAAKAAGDGDLLPWGVLGGNYLEVDRYESASPVVCVFCLSDIEEGEEVRELRCRHLFHRRCLDPWLACRRATCPLCRDPQQQQQQEEQEEEEDEELEYPAMAWLAYAPSWAW